MSALFSRSNGSTRERTVALGVTAVNAKITATPTTPFEIDPADIRGQCAAG
jgi:hypothetical protein